MYGETFVRISSVKYGVNDKIEMYNYATSCLTKDGKIWNFATDKATDNLYVCEDDTDGCKINST